MKQSDRAAVVKTQSAEFPLLLGIVLNLMLGNVIYWAQFSGIEQHSPVQASTSLSNLQETLLPNGINQSVSTAQNHSKSLPSDTGDDWMRAAQNYIQKSEYNIKSTVSSQSSTEFQAPNRQHDFRTYFNSEGVRVVPRKVSEQNWEWNLRLTGFGTADHIQSVKPASVITKDNRIEYDRGELVEWYVNDEKGLEQGFIIKQAPQQGASEIILQMEVSGDLSSKANKNQIDLYHPKSGHVLSYSNLKVWDANKKLLEADMGLIGDGLQISVNAHEAVYPIVVDPIIAGGIDVLLQSNQDSAFMGYSVSLSGDFNGDGYSDVVIGSPGYDNSVNNEGAAFVFYGSSSGIAGSSEWADGQGVGYSALLVSGQAGSDYGFSISSLGDVNGDGYDDLAIGAPHYSDNEYREGAVLIYYGSSEGVNNTPDSTLQSNSIMDNGFGYSIGHGDFNDDGYDDVLVGAPYYQSNDTTDFAEGFVFIFYGTENGITSSDVIDTDFEGILNGIHASAVLQSNNQGAYFGISVTGGDVNGDGVDDVVVGASNYRDVEINEGAAFVFLGSRGYGIVSSEDGGSSGVNSDILFQSNQQSSGFGVSVAVVDIDGDGFGDVVVGADRYQSDSVSQDNEGAVFIFKGDAIVIESSLVSDPDGSGELTGINADYILQSNQANSGFGGSVSTAGDLNADGISDLIVGAWSYAHGEQDEGVAFIFLGSRSAFDSSDSNNSDVVSGIKADYILESNQASVNYGASVSGGGDINGDGFSDVVIGAQGYSKYQEYEGSAYVYYGSLTGIKSSESVDPDPLGQENGIKFTSIFQSNLAASSFGLVVADAGDINGDGYSDILIGAPDYDSNPAQYREGAVFVFYGKAEGIDSSLLDDPDGVGPETGINADLIIPFDQVADFGYSVAGAGDVNGDGYSDVIVGARFYNVGINEGAAFLYLGSQSGLHVVPDSVLQPNQNDALFGSSVAAAGDVNGDGYGDIIIGSPGYSMGQSKEGAAFIFYGSSGVIASSSEQDPDGYASLNGVNASVILQSNQSNAYFGSVVSGAGDVNGDGFSDVIIGTGYGANSFDDGQNNEGAAFIYYGSIDGIQSSDNNDPDFISGLKANVVLQSNQANAMFGSSVSAAGDVNGDGFDDVIVGSFNEQNGFDSGEAQEGAVFVFYGSPGGIESSDRVNPLVNEGIKASAFLQSNLTMSGFGSSISAIYDINGDGYDDIAVGSSSKNFYSYSDGEYSEGAVFIFYGSVAGVSSSIDDESGLQLINANSVLQSNQAGAAFGVSVSSAGDINGDGFKDVLVGAHKYESDASTSDEGAAFLFVNNEGSGKNIRPVLITEEDVNSVVLNRIINRVKVKMTAYHPGGAGIAKLQLEICKNGYYYGHIDCLRVDSENYQNINNSGTDITLVSPDLQEGFYRVRARFIFANDSGNSIRYSPWYIPNTGVNRVIRIIVDTNGDGQSDNVAPQISGTPVTTAAPNALYSFRPVASDRNFNETLTFSVENLPAWASFNPVTGELSGTPLDADYGVYSGISIRVTDTQGAYLNLVPFNITVIDPSGPHINSVVVNNGNGTYTVTLSCFDAGSGCAGGIRYTTNGNTANAGSTLYTGPITVSDPAQVMSWAQDNEGNVNHAQAARFVSIASPVDDFIGAPAAISGSYLDLFAPLASVVLQIADEEGNGLILQNGRQALQPGLPGSLTASLNTTNDTWYLDFQSGIAWVPERRYHITVIATDVYGNESRVTSSFVYYAGGAVTTSLNMTLLKSSIEVNGTVDIQATLKRSDNASFDFTNQGYALVLHAEYLGSTPVTSGMSQAITGSSFITFDEVGSGVGDGNFIFNQAGYYEVWVEFAGNAILSAATSTRQVINVGTTAGYAVIIQGKLSSELGLESHNKTTKRIYNTLRARGFSAEDIYYFSYFYTKDDTVDALPSKAGIGSAIAGLASKVNDKPADVYVFMVDHGGVATQSSETSFYIDNEVITPTDLDTWLDALETGLTDQTLTNRIAIVGACYSGGFLSIANNEPNRVVISSAAALEQSFKGPVEADGIRTGELFIEYLLDELELGARLGNAFKTATRLTEAYTRKGDANAVIDSNLDTSVQHPQLNDNADSKGTNAVFVNDETVATADGQLAATLKLGFDRESDKNDSELVARILGVPKPIYLGVGNSTALSLKVNDDSLVSAAYAEIRPPQQVLSVQPLGTSEQVASSYDKQGFSQSGAANSYDLTYNSFTQSGVYEVFYYANDLSGVLVEPFRSLVYRDSTGNANAPTQVTLLEPVNGASEINGRAAIFDWTDASDADGHAVTYTFFIADSSDFNSFRQANRDTGGCSDTAMPLIQYGLTSSSTFVDARSRLCEGSTYFWKVQAVDPYGKHSDSATFSFTTGAANNTVGVIVAMVKSAQTSLPLLDMALSAIGQQLVQPAQQVSGVQYNGNYVMFINNPSGSFPLVVTDPAGDYQQKQITATVKGDETQEYVISLSANNTVDSDSDGIPDNSDNCPLVANASQLDTDADGQGNACDTDDDNDGMSDVFETTYGLNPLDASDAALDNDGDGYSNLAESMNNPNTNPNQADAPQVDTDSDDIPDNSDNCPLVANASQQNNDGDSQGDACDVDDDNDGMSDTYELLYNLNPLNASDAALDNDNDGKTNLEEFLAGSSPISAETVVNNSGGGGGGGMIQWWMLLVLLMWLGVWRMYRSQYCMMHRIAPGYLRK